jgi:hypothetical protein
VNAPDTKEPLSSPCTESYKDKFCFVLKQPGMPNSVTLHWGFCIPSTCHAEDLLAGLNSVLHHDVTVAVSELDCHTNKEKELGAIDCAAM